MKGTRVRSRGALVAVLFALFLLLGLTPLLAQGPDGAVVAVATQLEIEATLLFEDRAEHDKLSRQRSEMSGRLSAAHSTMDGLVQSAQDTTVDRIAELRTTIDAMEAARSGVLHSERILVDRIQDRLKKLRLLEVRLIELRGRTVESGGALSGSWSLVLLPTDLHGTATLEQSGTIITGTYRLDGGWSGSLQGTLVNRKVHLVRIDSKLGRSMEFEGYISPDRQQIRGSWLDYELAGGDGATGQWSARRMSATEEP